MLVIGLIGGIASGKSFVANCFRELGAEVISADEIGHRVLENIDVVRAIQQEWPQVIDSSGKISRSELAKVVFRATDHSVNLEKLERLTHPRISEQIDMELARLQSAGCAAVVLDAPVLIEAGWAAKCNRVVMVEAPLDVRRSRALGRGWRADELERREQVQSSLARKREFATDIIRNDISPEETRSQVSQTWLKWGLAPRPSTVKN
jgi:dephospho-CoA kinase